MAFLTLKFMMILHGTDLVSHELALRAGNWLADPKSPLEPLCRRAGRTNAAHHLGAEAWKSVSGCGKDEFVADDDVVLVEARRLLEIA